MLYNVVLVSAIEQCIDFLLETRSHRSKTTGPLASTVGFPRWARELGACLEMK